MRRKTGLLAFATAVVTMGALAVPAMAGDDELRLFNVVNGSFDVVDGGSNDRGDVVEVDVRYDCKNRDELSDQEQSFAVAVIARQGGNDDPEAEGTGIRTRDCDQSDDDDRVTVPVSTNPGSGEFNGNNSFTFEAVGASYLSDRSGFTDLEFEEGSGS